ncbi:MAG: glycoside hydrolase family 2 protein [Christensenellales bacterium]
MIKQSFNRDWTFSKGAGGFFRPAQGEVCAVTLPHDAMIHERREAGNPAGAACGYFPGGSYVYNKTLTTAPEDAGKTFILQFEGMYNRGWVFVNGTLAGATHYGYDELTLDITPYLYFGGDNLITVKVINADLPNSRWYTGSGIIRPVSLYVGGQIRIEADGIRISTPQVREDMAEVLVRTDVVYDGKARKTVTLRTELIGEKGETAAADSTPVTLEAEGMTTVTRRLYVRDPALWSTETPNLYGCRVTIAKEGEVLDTGEETFGIRRFELDPIGGLRLNGQPILLRGGCIHHDNGIVGAATFDRAEERRIEILKEAGFNSVRISHNSSSRALLRACDRLGMLVMEESFDMWTQTKSLYDHGLVFSETWEGEVERIVRKDYNHPSVFMYSIGNEIPEPATPDGARLNRRIAEKFRKEDPTRYVTNAFNGLFAVGEELPKVMADLGFITQEQMALIMEGGKETGDGNINEMMTSLMSGMNAIGGHPLVEERLCEAFDALDIVGLNYMRGAYRLQQGYNPHRVFYGSETFSPDIDLNWREVKANPACIGDYCWTAWDYLGEAGIGVVEYDGSRQFQKAYPAYIAYCGDIDITGYRRPMSYYRETVFGLRKRPYIAVQLPEYYGVEAQCTPWATRDTIASWTWEGFEGKPCAVEVFSDAPEVELLLNGESLGRKAAGEENRFKAVFETEYRPGKLEAAAYYPDGRKTSHCLVTAGKTAGIAVRADRTAIGRDELSYLTFTTVDEKGTVNTCDRRRISVSVTGEGVLQGYGSADYKSKENFFDRERTPFYGRVVAAVRAGGVPGTIRVTAEAEGLDPVSVEIRVKE